MSQQWQERSRPARLERRYEFDSYVELRDFLDQAAVLSEREGVFPDMGFGRDYVNMTIHAEQGSEELEPGHRQLAQQIDALGGYTSAN